MERFAGGENGVFGYKHPKSFEGSESMRNSSLEMDFSDVFGGPPRRFSMQEIKMRYSFSDAMESEEDDAVDHQSWAGLTEKPVFGGESVNRRRFAIDDFYGDIFKIDGSPRKAERDPFGSAPGSRALSPARILPASPEPYGTSLPAQFSLPAKLTTRMDSPVISSDKSSPVKSKVKDGTSNGMTSPQISKASFAKFLNRAIKGKNEPRGDRQSYRQSPLSREVTLTNEEPPHLVPSDEEVKDRKSNVESSDDGNQFHFSIYKWAGGGVPLMIPIRVGKSPKLEEKFNIERSTSSNGRTEFDNLDSERRERDIRDTEPASANNHSVSSNGKSESLKVEEEEKDKGNNQDSMNDANLEVLESKVLNGASKSADVGKATLKNKTVLQSSQKGEKTEKLTKEIDANESKAARSEKTSLSALLSENIEAKGTNKQQNESVVKGTRTAGTVHIRNKEKKNDGRKKNSNKASANKDDLPGSPLTSGNTPGKTGVKGKVRDFVKIFNHDTVGKTKTDSDARSRSFRWKNTDKYAANSEGSSIYNANEKSQSSRVDDSSNASSKVDENPSKDSVNHPSNIKTSNNESSRNNDQKTSSLPESFHGTDKVTRETSEDLFQESFSVEELSQDQDKGLQTNGVPEEFEDSDDKIRQWSKGRKGNIRSLLSTLQLVLWPESGWKPVPLVNIIEGSAVKRTYQRALLYLHPDKLQQKGASSQQKYVAEKVFDIIQEAWDQFNSVGGL